MTPDWLPLACTAALLAVVSWRSWWQRKHYGSWGIVLFHTRDARQRLHAWGVVFLFLALVYLAAARALDPAFVAVRPLVRPPGSFGAALCAGGLALMVRGQLDLGPSWRVGIDADAAPGLVVRGLYRYSRNPIYVGLLTFFLGITLLLPVWPTVLLAFGAFVGVRQQALAEERYLETRYGAPFRNWAARVGRFLPWFGRLR